MNKNLLAAHKATPHLATETHAPALAKHAFERAVVDDEQPKQQPKKGVKMRDLDGNGFVGNKELNTQKQTPSAIANDLVQDAKSKGAQVIMIGEMHGATPVVPIFLALEAMEKQYAGKKLAFGVEYNQAQIPQAMAVLNSYSKVQLKAMNAPQLRDAQAKLYNALLRDICLNEIKNSPTHAQQFFAAAPDVQEILMADMIKMNEKSARAQGHNDYMAVMLQAKRCGFEVFAFDIPKTAKENTTGLNKQERLAREKTIAANIYEPIGSKRADVVVTLSGAGHAAFDASGIAAFINKDNPKRTFATEFSANGLLSEKCVNVVGYQLMQASPNFNDKEVSRAFPYGPYDGFYSF